MKQNNKVIAVAIIMIVAAALSRVVLYPVSFSPLIAMSIFGGAVISDKRFSLLIPIAAIFLSDVLFEVCNIAPGFYGWSQLVNYALLIGITYCGSYLQKINITTVLSYVLGSCVGFYLLSNTANFFISNPVYKMYPQTVAGYVENMIAGLPFLKTSLVATACYAAVFFGAYVLMAKTTLVKKAA